MATRKTIHILTEGFHSPNGRAFLMPLLQYRSILHKDYGIDLRFYTQRHESMNQCDVLLADSKFYKPYWASVRRDEAIAHFAEDYSQAGKSIFVDLNDSTGWIVPHVLPYVDTYLKSQLAKDRKLYAQPLYEHRPHSDYYHRTCGIRNNEDIWSQPINNPDERAKLKVGWNSGLANYSLTGLWLMGLYERTGWTPLLQKPRYYAPPAKHRPLDVSYRFGVSYPQETVRHQRLKLKEIMTAQFDIPTNKLNRIQYYREMYNTRVVISPFGYGEITLKDFETFLCGAALMKPNMDFMETWPHFFQPDITYMPFSWDMEDAIDKLEALLRDEKYRQRMAEAGQQLYYKHVTGPDAGALFCAHFVDIIS